MRVEILTCIRLLIESDGSVTPEHRREILKVCKRDPSRKRRRLGTKRDVAEILGCHPETVKRYAKRGALKPIHFSARKVRYDMDEVEALAERGIYRKDNENDQDGSLYVPAS